MPRVNVTGNGTIILGDYVSADGFRSSFPLRVQTHIHRDHLDDFNSSKGYQDILMTHATKDLLIAEWEDSLDLKYRNNIIGLDYYCTHEYLENHITLYENGHMLGAAQVLVKLPDGKKCGYSGDFNWPLSNVINVDELVIDSSYGSPKSIRQFSQEDANNALIEIVSKGIKKGPVFVRSHRGTLERALSCLNGMFKAPIVATESQYRVLQVYQKYGYDLSEVFFENDPDIQDELTSGNYIMLGGKYDKGTSNATVITLSAYYSRMKYPYIEFSPTAFSVAMSDHADFRETLKYVEETSAEFVVTDNTRGGSGVELAIAIQKELGIEAIASQFDITREWG